MLDFLHMRHYSEFIIRGKVFMNHKILIANIILIVLIVFLGYLVATTHYTPPEVPSYSSLATPTAATAESGKAAETTETDYGTKPPKLLSLAGDKYPRFGKAPIFDTIIPKPTPRPTRTPKPKPTPNITNVTARWKLTSLFGDTASFEDSGTHQEWDMKVGQTRDVKYRNQTCKVKLEKVDEDKFEVIITFGAQSRTLSMF